MNLFARSPVSQSAIASYLRTSKHVPQTPNLHTRIYPFLNNLILPPSHLTSHKTIPPSSPPSSPNSSCLMFSPPVTPLPALHLRISPQSIHSISHPNPPSPPLSFLLVPVQTLLTPPPKNPARSGKMEYANRAYRNSQGSPPGGVKG